MTNSVSAHRILLKRISYGPARHTTVSRLSDGLDVPSETYMALRKLSYNEGWTDYLGKCVEVFQRNRGLTPDRKVGLITTYWLLSGIVK